MLYIVNSSCIVSLVSCRWVEPMKDSGGGNMVGKGAGLMSVGTVV